MRLLNDIRWMEKARCAGMGDEPFHRDWDVGAIEESNRICARCPVRTDCLETALFEEDGLPVDMRFGMRAFTTPAQRVSIERRYGGLSGRDPMALVKGYDNVNDREIPPIPLEGDNWTRHHTTLARKLVAWLRANKFKKGDQLPTQTLLCEELSCNHNPLKRVQLALVADGTLDMVGEQSARRYVIRRLPKGVSWSPVHLRKTGVEACPAGHLYTDDNTYRQPANPSRRQCRTCRRDRYSRKKAQP